MKDNLVDLSLQPAVVTTMTIDKTQQIYEQFSDSFIVELHENIRKLSSLKTATGTIFDSVSSRKAARRN